MDRSGWHLILLAKNKTGYFNLCKMVSISWIDGFYGKPRIDKRLLEQYHEGVICASACLGGEIPQLIMAGKMDEAEQSVRWFQSVFGEDYYLEIHHTLFADGTENITTQSPCIFCHESGRCQVCYGTGQQYWRGLQCFQPCRMCGGNGKCTQCGGGKVFSTTMFRNTELLYLRIL